MFFIEYLTPLNYMSELEEFVSQTILKGKKEIKKLDELQEILRQLEGDKEKPIYISQITSNT